MNKTFLDTETCGFCGPICLIQYATNDNDVVLYEPWFNKIETTLELLKNISFTHIVGFNLSFDWFHIQKFYNCLELLYKKLGNIEPIDYINDFAEIEPQARDGNCIKPFNATDLMLHARKGKFQNTMDRRPIRIRKVPRVLAEAVVHELNKRIYLQDYLFEKRKVKRDKWEIFECIPKQNDLVEIVCNFQPSASLKTLCFATGIRDPNDRKLIKEVTSTLVQPVEFAWAPFALAVSNSNNNWEYKGKYAWPAVIEEHLYHWRYDKYARQYALDDVLDTRDLYKYLSPSDDDFDSVLACMVGSIRWKGYTVDIDKLKQLKNKEIEKLKDVPTDPKRSKMYVMEGMDEFQIESSGIRTSSKKVILELLAKNGNERAQKVIAARQAQYKINLFDKFIQCGRFQPNQTVLGSLSSRMSGRSENKDGTSSNGLNSMGIPHDKSIRKCFTLKHEDMILSGGDFEAFEVSIAEAVYNDNNLRSQLLTCHHCNYVRTLEEFDNTFCPNCKLADSKCLNTDCINFKKSILIKDNCLCPSCNTTKTDDPEPTLRKIHGLFAMALFPGNTYDDITKSKGTPLDMYDMGKRGFFGGLLYGGDEGTLVRRLGILEENAKNARNTFFKEYKGVQQEQVTMFNKFCSLRQPGGLGTKFEWYEPDNVVYSLFDFPRFFTLENTITKEIFKLAEKPPASWLRSQAQIIRKRDRGPQKVGGATMSALFATACNIQAGVMRAALNHRIQSTGATVTKLLQVELWSIQPVGVHEWCVMPFQVHDEVMCPHKESLTNEIISIVDEFVKKYREQIPLLKIVWHKMTNWAEK